MFTISLFYEHWQEKNPFYQKESLGPGLPSKTEDKSPLTLLSVALEPREQRARLP